MAGAPAPICACTICCADNTRAACATGCPRTNALAGTAVIAPGLVWLIYVLWMLFTIVVLRTFVMFTLFTRL
jgi:hypothetical protein